MAEKKKFLLRLDPALWAVLERWAADELRSVNGQIEFLLREAAKRVGRWPATSGSREQEAGGVGTGEPEDT